MSDFMKDITNYVIPAGNTDTTKNAKRTTASESIQLDMTDFLTLMVTELTNQSIDETADTSDMLNQMVQMQMVQALVNMTDASVMSYAASLVGKEVTVGQTDGSGNITEVVGQVTGTGTMGGKQVVFVGDKYYYMNEIMAVGRLPKQEETEEPGDKGDGTTEGTGGTESGGSEKKPESSPVAPEVGEG